MSKSKAIFIVRHIERLASEFFSILGEKKTLVDIGITPEEILNKVSIDSDNIDSNKWGRWDGIYNEIRAKVLDSYIEEYNITDIDKIDPVSSTYLKILLSKRRQNNIPKVIHDSFKVFERDWYPNNLSDISISNILNIKEAIELFEDPWNESIGLRFDYTPDQSRIVSYTINSRHDTRCTVDSITGNLAVCQSSRNNFTVTVTTSQDTMSLDIKFFGHGESMDMTIVQKKDTPIRIDFNGVQSEPMIEDILKLMSDDRHQFGRFVKMNNTTN